MSVYLADMDGVVAEWSDGVRQRIAALGLDTTFLDWSRWEGHGEHAPSNAGTLISWAMSVPGFYLSLNPVPGVAWALNKLANAHEVWLCSTPDSTNPTCASDKIAWAEKHLGIGWGKRVILTHDKTLVRGDFLIDDKPEVTGSMTPTWEHIYFERPYNAHITGRRRITNWNELESILA